MAAPDSLLFPRFSSAGIAAAMGDTPVVMINGPRQCGKTTLARSLVDDQRSYITLDDDTALAAARHDPAGFVRELDRAVIDEVQRAPELLRAIKKAVDDDRRAGRFLLTGSANVLTLPQVSESLAGRMAVVTLLPLSRSEIGRKKPSFLEKAFAGKPPRPTEIMIGDDLVQAVLAGGYPEMLRRSEPSRRQAWARDYIRAIVERDVRDIAGIDKLGHMPRLLQTLAHHSGQLTNFTQIGGQLGLDDKTTRKYVSVFEQLFLVHRLDPWFHNRIKRLVKTPKLHFLDAGLLATLLGATAERIARDRSVFGPILETFVVSEVMKQVSWHDESCTLHHYRDKDQDEVDVVIERPDGALIGLEVKAAASVKAGDFKGLRKLANSCGESFKLGVVLYDGERSFSFEDRLVAAPISCLWA